MKIYRKLLIAVFIFCFIGTHKTNAQTPVTVSTAGHHFTIPKFSEGAVTSFDNDFVKRGIIQSIKQSGAHVEIRVYRWTQGRAKSMLFGRVFSIECDSSNVWFILYSGRGELPGDDEPGSLLKSGLQPANIVDSVQYYKSLTESPPSMAIDSLLDTLIAGKIFTLKDEPQFIQSLKLNQPKSKTSLDSTILKCDGCFADETLLIEIKAGDKMRNFRLLAKDYGEPPALKQSLLPYTRLRAFLYSLMYRLL